ncbi:glucose-6-phosphate isomerase [Candidatus Pelagibacter sp. HTCC7211]|uniref:glucose-6-phosphate isomerase n=1 Tax=Pelagibacter sp. (strain HTCC7211) TaxID=439493 RepID=UPI000183B3A2|nr:glucose-6-phosphate isomerase [Candidatus Pelagibacter sp. HTCC7211]EDZ59843.1 glucose-6-phosphate isomerase [Candidatus Pelagibacter sp. HTCC7211]
MISPRISFKNFKSKKVKSSLVRKKLTTLIKEKNEILKSLSKDYKNNFNHKNLKKFKKSLDFRVIGMGGSSLGAKAIYDFLRHKIKKNFFFIDNLKVNNLEQKKKNHNNIIISKSGNTIETIVNVNLLIKKKDQNILITENKKNYLNLLAKKLKADIIHHNDYIGGRYSVLSEVGMLPAELMGLNINNFKQLNFLIKNKSFFNNLISNVSSTLYFIQNKKFNSIILNYDEKSDSLFKWYQQLIAESLGKKKSGILPVISSMPKDNHSVTQLYLDGFRNNFFTFFYVHEDRSEKLNNEQILSSKNYLKNKSIGDIIFSQKKATENVFNRQNIPFRSFEIKKRDEKTLGELFCFFILETILIAKSLNINPYDQPAVELIKQETKKILI